jgi:hypothetical protein
VVMPNVTPLQDIEDIIMEGLQGPSWDEVDSKYAAEHPSMFFAPDKDNPRFVVHEQSMGYTPMQIYAGCDKDLLLSTR